MKTAAIIPEDLRRSVIAVPPLCRRPDFSLASDQNRTLMSYLRAGGVTTFLYGGNANLYNLSLREFVLLLDDLQDAAADDDWIIPSVGPDFGKAQDQIEILRGREFPTALVLPLRFPTDPSGVASGLAALARQYEKPVVAYIKEAGYIAPDDLGRLFRDGSICAIKYAVSRQDTANDNYLQALLEHLPATVLVSGLGEKPVIAHRRSFGLTAFTSGTVCITPRISNRLLRVIQETDGSNGEAIRAQILPFESIRDKYSPIRVLHEAVRLAGIAETGPLAPFLSSLTDPKIIEEIREAVTALRSLDASIEFPVTAQ